MTDEIKKDQGQNPGQSGQQSGQEQQKNPQDISKKNPSQDRNKEQDDKQKVMLPPAKVIRHKNIVAEIWANRAGRGFRYTTVISHAYVGHHGVGLTRVIPAEELSDLRWVAYKADKWIRREKRRSEAPMILQLLFRHF